MNQEIPEEVRDAEDVGSEEVGSEEVGSEDAVEATAGESTPKEETAPTESAAETPAEPAAEAEPEVARESSNGDEQPVAAAAEEAAVTEEAATGSENGADDAAEAAAADVVAEAPTGPAESSGPAESAEPEAAEKPKKPARKKKKKTTKVAASEEDGEFEWYVLRVQSGRESTVSNNLRKKLVLAKKDHLVREIAVPKQKLTEIKEGKKKIREQKLFPGYVFLEMKLEDDLWYLIRDTSGIGDFVGSHRHPIPMPASEVSKIRRMMEEKEEPQEVKIDLVKNDPVKIKEGPFENFDGYVEEVQPGKGMVRVMVSIFGRATPVDLEYWQVEKL